MTTTKIHSFVSLKQLSGKLMAAPEHSVVDDAFKLLAKSTALTLSEYTSITQSEADIEQHLKQHIETF